MNEMVYGHINCLCLDYYAYNAHDKIKRILLKWTFRKLGYNVDLFFVSHDHDIIASFVLF